MKQFLFVDIFTQKGFVENFGSQAIEDAPDIRENLMNITALARIKKIPILSLLYSVFQADDFDKLSDTDLENFDLAQKVLSSTLDLSSLQFPEESATLDNTVLFVYGVPLETAISSFCKHFVKKAPTLWIIQDAVKATNKQEQLILEDLKSLGAKLITTRNLEKFLNL